MFPTLLTETAGNGGFPVTGLITVLVAAAVFYPIQKKIRASASRGRRARWAEEDRLAEEERQSRDTRPSTASDDVRPDTAAGTSPDGNAEIPPRSNGDATP